MNKLHIIPNEVELSKQIELAEKYNLAFEYNEFFRPEILDDETEKKRIISLYKNQSRDRSMDTLHGSFFDVTIHSSDSKIREVSELRMRQSMEVAADLGVKGVVFHTNYIPNFTVSSYIDGWVEKSKEFYLKLLKEYQGIDIYVENMFDVDLAPVTRIAREMFAYESDSVSQHFGICLDYAHAVIFVKGCQNLEQNFESIKALTPYIKHMHINDNDLKDDLHQALGDGKIDWDFFKRLISKAGYDGSILIEVNGLEKQMKSIETLKKLKLL